MTRIGFERDKGNRTLSPGALAACDGREARGDRDANSDGTGAARRLQTPRNRPAAGAPLLLFSFDAGLNVAGLNPEVQDILGFAREEAEAEPGWFLRVAHPDDRDRIRQALMAALAEGGSFVEPCRLLGRAGRTAHGLLQAFPSRSVNGRTASLEAVFVETGERARLESLLARNEKLKTLGAISAELVHEIRNPLMALAGFARRLDKKLPDVPEVEIILSESARLERLLRRITDYLKPARFNLAPCSVNALLADAVGLLFPETEAKRAWFELDLAEELPTAAADPEALGQVFVTLARAALAAADVPGVIHARTRQAGEAVLVEFRHLLAEGRAPDPETMFLPFEEGGEGGGLALCSRTLREMGGGLSFAEELGEAVFTAVAPLTPGGRLPQEAPARRTVSGEGSFETGALLSRHAFEDLFKRLRRSSMRRRASFSLLLVEPDGPSPLSEAELAVLAGLLEPLLSAVQAVGRLGSGELGALLPGCATGEALRLAKAARERLTRELPAGFPGVTLGAAACVAGTGPAPSEILEAAKKAVCLGRKNPGGGPRVLEAHAQD